MSRYRVAPAARDDLKRISRYIAVQMQSPQGAKRLRADSCKTSGVWLGILSWGNLALGLAKTFGFGRQEIM